MAERFVVVPDSAARSVGESLLPRLASLAESIRSHHLEDLVDEPERLWAGRGNGSSENCEMLLWGIGAMAYEVAWSSWEPRHRSEGLVTASLTDGVVAEVLLSGRPVSADDRAAGGFLWTNLGDRRGATIGDLAAAPVVSFGRAVGVLSLVRYVPVMNPSEYVPLEREVPELQRSAIVMSRLVERRLLRRSLGMETD